MSANLDEEIRKKDVAGPALPGRRRDSSDPQCRDVDEMDDSPDSEKQRKLVRRHSKKLSAAK